MTTNWGTTELYGAPTRTPVILPMRPNGSPEPEKQSDRSSDGALHFTIPELSSTAVSAPPSPAPTAVWPTCERPETVRACAETAEAIYRRLQSSGSTILALTSPGDGDGKTNLMVGMAPELAKRAGGLLAIDADSLKPDLSLRVILPERNLTTASNSLIYPTNRSELSLLPNMGGGCSSNWDREWFDDLRDRWKLVLLDTPSLEHAEPSPLMRYCDGVYLVVRLGYTARRAVAESVRAIRARGSRLLGSITIG